jgi:sugar transferase (PEP-CTERM system associated)
MKLPIYRQSLKLRIGALALAEAALLTLAPLLVNAVAPGVSVPEGGPAIVLFAASGIVALAALGLYSPRQRAQLAGVLLRIAVALLLAMVIAAVVSFFVPPLRPSPARLATWAGVALPLVGVFRVLAMRFLDEDAFKRRVLVFGAGARAGALTRLRRRADQRGFLLQGFVPAPNEEPRVPAERIVQCDPAQLLEYAQANRIEEIVVAMDDRRRQFPLRELLTCRLAGIDVIDIVSFLERETGRVQLDLVNPSWMIFGEGFRRDPVRQATKRIFDLVVSLGLLIVAWPLMLLTALAIVLEDGPRAPILYRQRRVGLDGQAFDVLKFRSMSVDAEADGTARWASPTDRRVTRVGRVIRKLRLDELPQILNVLKGDMSFVGPRPERPEFVEELSASIPFYDERHCTKPGITGWAQLCYPYGASERDALEKLQYDLYYVKNHTLLFDLLILVQTVEVVLFGKGAR